MNKINWIIFYFSQLELIFLRIRRHIKTPKGIRSWSDLKTILKNHSIFKGDNGLRWCRWNVVLDNYWKSWAWGKQVLCRFKKPLLEKWSFKGIWCMFVFIKSVKNARKIWSCVFQFTSWFMDVYIYMNQSNLHGNKSKIERKNYHIDLIEIIWVYRPKY